MLKKHPIEWRECAEGILHPFFSCSVAWPESYPEGHILYLVDFERMLGLQQHQSSIGPRLTRAAQSIVRYLQIGNSDYLAQWYDAFPFCCRENAFIFPFFDEFVASESATAAVTQLHVLMNGTGYDKAHFLERAHRLLEDARERIVRIAPREGVARVLIRARQRGIPVSRHAKMAPVYRFGNGYLQQRIWRGYTSNTSHIATVLSTQKHLTAQLLREYGLPAPQNYPVEDLAHARKAASLIGYPVVVKPSSTDFGTAVSIGINNDTELSHAFSVARKFGVVLVEKHIDGHDFRLHVVNDRCVGVIRRDPPTLVGNGVDSVETLIARMTMLRTQDPELQRYKPVSIEDPLVRSALQRQKLTIKSVAEKGQMIRLRDNANVSTGGVATLVTSEAHPDNLRLAERAASCLGLDVAGVDFISRDISVSWRENGGVICEVNPNPGISHLDAEKFLLDYLFSDHSCGRIPVVVIVGKKAHTLVFSDLLHELARSKNLVIGHVASGLARIGEWPISGREQSCSELLFLVLAASETQFVTVEVSPSELLHNGLNIGYCTLAVLCCGDKLIENICSSTRSVISAADTILTRPSVEQLTRWFERSISLCR